jgi:hypothetical protein
MRMRTTRRSDWAQLVALARGTTPGLLNARRLIVTNASVSSRAVKGAHGPFFRGYLDRRWHQILWSVGVSCEGCGVVRCDAVPYKGDSVIEARRSSHCFECRKSLRSERRTRRRTDPPPAPALHDGFRRVYWEEIDRAAIDCLRTRRIPANRQSNSPARSS